MLFFEPGIFRGRKRGRFPKNRNRVFLSDNSFSKHTANAVVQQQKERQPPRMLLTRNPSVPQPQLHGQVDSRRGETKKFCKKRCHVHAQPVPQSIYIFIKHGFYLQVYYSKNWIKKKKNEFSFCFVFVGGLGLCRARNDFVGSLDSPENNKTTASSSTGQLYTTRGLTRGSRVCGKKEEVTRHKRPLL